MRASDTRWQRHAPFCCCTLISGTCLQLPTAAAAALLFSRRQHFCALSSAGQQLFSWRLLPGFPLEVLQKSCWHIQCSTAGAVCCCCSCVASNNYCGTANAWSIACRYAVLLSLLLCKIDSAVLPLQAQCSAPSHSLRQCWPSAQARRRCLLVLTPLLPGFWWCTGQRPHWGMRPQPARQQRAGRRQASPHPKGPSSPRAPPPRTASMAHHGQPAQSPGAAVMSALWRSMPSLTSTLLQLGLQHHAKLGLKLASSG